MEFISKNQADTDRISESLAKNARPGDIFALSGELGSGKTTFSQFFARAIGVKERLTSPTFVILKKYKVHGNDMIGELFHVDCYRMADESEIDAVGLNEYLQQKDAVFLIEWPEKIWGKIGQRAKLIKFDYIDENTRKISF